jgi:hypothetical protein
VFNQELNEVLGPIETDLRRKKHLLIDQKSVKNIREGKVSFKVFDQSNSSKVLQEKQNTTYEER